MSALIGIELGSDRARAVAIEDTGRVLTSSTAEYATSSPRPGWSEQDPRDWWLACRKLLVHVTAGLRSDVAAIGLTGQMHGAVFLDDRGDVIRPAILADDVRTTVQCEQIAQRIGGDRIIEITGSPARTRFQAPKILWLRDVEPVQYRHLRFVIPPKDYVRFKLTGEVATDVSDASGTLLYDLRRHDWSAQILAALEIPREWLPAVRQSGDVTGRLAPAIASELGLPAGIPVAAGAGEHAAAALASATLTPGCVWASIDRRGVLTASSSQLTIDRSGRTFTFGHALPDRYQLLAITPSAGTSLRWWREMLGGTKTEDDLIGMASSAPLGADGLFFVPSVGAHEDGDSRGAFVGLRSHHTPAHLTRAVTEGIIFSLRYSLDAIRETGVDVQTVRATGMGAGRGFWRRLQADIFNRPVQRVGHDESSAYGAALLAGVAAGVYRDAEHATAVVPVSESVNQPDPGRARVYESVYSTFRQLYPALQVDAVRPAGRDR